VALSALVENYVWIRVYLLSSDSALPYPKSRAVDLALVQLYVNTDYHQVCLDPFHISYWGKNREYNGKRLHHHHLDYLDLIRVFWQVLMVFDPASCLLGIGERDSY